MLNRSGTHTASPDGTAGDGQASRNTRYGHIVAMLRREQSTLGSDGFRVTFGSTRLADSR